MDDWKFLEDHLFIEHAEIKEYAMEKDVWLQKLLDRDGWLLKLFVRMNTDQKYQASIDVVIPPIINREVREWASMRTQTVARF